MTPRELETIIVKTIAVLLVTAAVAVMVWAAISYGLDQRDAANHAGDVR